MSSFHFILLCFLCLFVAGLVAAQQGDVVTYERLRDSDREPQNWMHYWGNYQGTHYSALKQITKTNVANLQLQWSIQLPGASPLETEPVVIDSIMYTSGQPGTVLAIDAKTGKRGWRIVCGIACRQSHRTRRANGQLVVAIP